MVLSPRIGGKRYKVNRADFSARRGFRRYSSKVAITPDKKLPKLNLASPDLKHAGRRVQNWIRQGVAILVTPFAELKIEPTDYWYFNQPHLHWGCTKKHRFNEGKTSRVKCLLLTSQDWTVRMPGSVFPPHLGETENLGIAPG